MERQLETRIAIGNPSFIEISRKPSRKLYYNVKRYIKIKIYSLKIIRTVTGPI